QFIIASHITVVATGDPDREYEADKILLMYPIYNSFTNTKRVIIKLRILYPTHAPCFTYIHSNNSIKPESIAVEATDIDFIYAPNFNVIHNMHDSLSTTVSGHHSDFDIIIDEIESRSVTSNLDLSPAGVETTQFPKGKKRLSDLALDCLDLNIKPNDEASDLEEQKLAKNLLKNRDKQKKENEQDAKLK
ncbi:10571_t:CDS:2, partial [Gigaspora margarita]